MSTFNLGSRTVRLGKPIRVAKGVGHMWFPTIHRFPSGELMAEWSMMPDIHCFAYVAGASHSTDGGKTWSQPYSFGNYSNQYIPQADGSLLGLPYYIYPRPATQDKKFATDLTFVRPGGGYDTTPFGMTVEYPFGIYMMATDAAMMNFTGTPLKVDGRWLATTYGMPAGKGDAMKLDLYIVESRDEGRSWKYLSTVSRWEDVPDAAPDPNQPREGPCEASMTALASGEILCVYRVGNYDKYPFWQARSRDDGKTWMSHEAMPGVGRVEPCLTRIKNGTLVLSGGRPGNKLWISDDKIGKQWHYIDLTAHHNATCDTDEKMAEDGSFTTAYSEMVEVSPNRLLYIYDRCPFGWAPVPIDKPERNMIFLVEIEVG